MSADADVVVLGAGLSGLVAARALCRAGKRVLVLEARDRVGGRTLSQRLGSDVIDLGGQWIGPRQQRVAALAAELGVQSFPQHHHGNKVLELGGRRSTYRGTIPSLPLLSLLELEIAIRRIDRMARRVPLDEPESAPRAARWDAVSVEAIKRRLLRTRPARSVFDAAVRAIFAAEPSELSFLFFLFYLRAGGGLMTLASVDGGAQQDRFVGGAQQLSIRLHERIVEMGAAVELGAAALAIAQDEQGVTITSERGSHRAQLLVSAVPPPLAARIHFERALPLARQQLLGRMPMGSAIKCVAAYPRPFWKEAGLSGEAVSDGEPVRLAFDDSSHDGSQAALVAFVLGSAVRRWADAPPDELERAVLDHLARLFGPDAKSPTHFVSKSWPAERFSEGCYTSILAPGTLTELGAALRKPSGRLHWAGTETARDGTGYFEGAIEAGERAAREVIERLAGA